MKRFLILFSFAVLSVAANAAALSWGVANGAVTSPGGDGALLADATVYLVQGDASSASSVVDAIKTNDWNSSVAVDTAYTTVVIPDVVGGLVAVHEVTNPSWTVGSTLDFYLVIFSPDGNHFMVSAVKQGEIGDSGIGAAGSVEWDGSSIGTTSGGWQTIVPEPTALALLALGVAGLALRRKVA